MVEQILLTFLSLSCPRCSGSVDMAPKSNATFCGEKGVCFLGCLNLLINQTQVQLWRHYSLQRGKLWLGFKHSLTNIDKNHWFYIQERIGEKQCQIVGSYQKNLHPRQIALLCNDVIHRYQLSTRQDTTPAQQLGRSRMTTATCKETYNNKMKDITCTKKKQTTRNNTTERLSCISSYPWQLALLVVVLGSDSFF